MSNVSNLLNKFILQANEGSLKTAEYPKEYLDLKMKVSFGQGVLARVPWISFTAPEMTTSNGYYPVYLFYREQNIHKIIDFFKKKCSLKFTFIR